MGSIVVRVIEIGCCRSISFKYWMRVFHSLARLRDAHCAGEVALFADRIAAAGRKLYRIYKISVICRFTVAACALNSVDDLPVPIERTWIERRPRRMAVQAIRRNGASEVRLGVALVSWGEI